jgi:hypothetical protein
MEMEINSNRGLSKIIKIMMVVKINKNRDKVRIKIMEIKIIIMDNNHLNNSLRIKDSLNKCRILIDSTCFYWIIFSNLFEKKKN